MWTYLKRLRFYVKSVTEPTSSRLSSSEKSQDYLQEKENLDIFQSQFLDVPNAVTSTKTSSRKKFNPLTDTHSGLHEYEEEAF